MKYAWIPVLAGVAAVLGVADRLNAADPAKPGVTVQTDQKTGRVEVAEAGKPVLRYNFKTVSS